jgi:hypothetical protein
MLRLALHSCLLSLSLSLLNDFLIVCVCVCNCAYATSNQMQHITILTMTVTMTVTYRGNPLLPKSIFVLSRFETTDLNSVIPDHRDVTPGLVIQPVPNPCCCPFQQQLLYKAHLAVMVMVAVTDAVCHSSIANLWAVFCGV